MRCSKALVDMYTALCSVAEENAGVAAAHIAYAALLEKALSKVALQHVVSLEKLCQVWQLCDSVSPGVITACVAIKHRCLVYTQLCMRIFCLFRIACAPLLLQTICHVPLLQNSSAPCLGVLAFVYWPFGRPSYHSPLPHKFFRSKQGTQQD